MSNPHNWPYSDVDILPADTTEYYVLPDDYFPFSYEKLCAQSLKEDMKPLHELAIFGKHLYGTAAHGWFVSGHGVYHEDVVSYAAVAGFEEHDGKKLAEIGGVVTLPWERGNGYSTAVVSKVIELASSEEAIAEHGHEGLMAKCNESSIGLFVAKFGFEIVGQDGTKQIAAKLF